MVSKEKGKGKSRWPDAMEKLDRNGVREKRKKEKTKKRQAPTPRHRHKLQCNSPPLYSL